MRIVFMGSAEFGIPSLLDIACHHEIVAVVTTPPRQKGRGRKVSESPVAISARALGIKTIFTPQNINDEQLAQDLEKLNADVFVIIAFKILPRLIFSIPPNGTFNVHASLLPKYRGAAPIHRAIENGEHVTGVTVFRIDDGIDTGNVVVQKSCLIAPDETTPQLYERLSILGTQALTEALSAISTGKLIFLKQDNTSATGAPKLSKNNAVIDWKLSSKLIYNRIRAFKPFPGNFTQINNKRLSIDWAKAIKDNSIATPGTIINIERDFFDVACGSGTLRVITVKPEGKRSMSVRDFCNGVILKEGVILI